MPDNSVNRFIKDITDIEKRINHIYQQRLKQWDLTLNAYLALDSLFNYSEGIEPAQLADELGIQRQMVTLLLNDFTNHGYILKKENKTDHRRKVILLSKKGKRFAKEVIDCITEMDYLAMIPFSTCERDQIITFLRRYCENLIHQKE